ncbi:MAG: hypothetical protein KF752_09360 [Pirellulaceae bacterium]|nr:hypothetical protein [Pirellulaceae bacterium]
MHQPKFLQQLDAHIRRRLRAILVRQKKRLRHLYRHLQTRGVSQSQAWKTAYQIRSSLEAKQQLWCPQSLLPNAWFEQRLYRSSDGKNPASRVGPRTVYAVLTCSA